ncbi:MAG: complex I subunit 1 family protein [Planctomycetota bacterium]
MPTIYYFLTSLRFDAAGNLLPSEQLNFIRYWLSDTSLAALLAVLIPCAVVVGIILGVAGFSTYIERKLAADIQRRIGPNQCNVGSFFGAWARQIVANAKDSRATWLARLMAVFCQPVLPILSIVDKLLLKVAPGVIIFMADGLKLIMKEDIIADPVDKPLFRLAPLIVMASALAALAVLPFSDAWYVADFNIGIFYIAAITSLEVLGILMAGWASNNKWALLGGMRSAAQIVSYELPVGLAILTGVLISGTMSMQGMTYDQLNLTSQSDCWSNGWFWQWNIFHPAMFILAPIYFLAALAECNRTPFDIPEAESELVAGYHTEYSGMRFGFFFMAEYAMMIVVSGIAVTLFLGGWSTGIAPVEHWLTSGFKLQNGVMVPEFHWIGTLIHLGAFCIKTYSLVLLMMWIRWTLPRFRVDQMMTLCWKKLIPLSLLCLLLASVWMIIQIPLAAKLGADTLDHITFFLRLCFALGVIGWLGWFFLSPLTSKQQAQYEIANF